MAGLMVTSKGCGAIRCDSDSDSKNNSENIRTFKDKARQCYTGYSKIYFTKEKAARPFKVTVNA